MIAFDRVKAKMSEYFRYNISSPTLNTADHNSCGISEKHLGRAHDVPKYADAELWEYI